MIKTIVKKLLPFGVVSYIRAKRAKNKSHLKKIELDTKIEAILSGNKPINVELGSGAKSGSGDWITMDLNEKADIQYNLLAQLPFPDSSISKIYSSHFLEHFYTKDILNILKECHRVLIPGGWISACVPDGSIYINAYVNGTELDQNVWLRYKPAATIYSRIDIVNYMAYMDNEHKHLFDIENLLALFREAGFGDVRPRKIIHGLDMEVRDYQSIYVEAVK